MKNLFSKVASGLGGIFGKSASQNGALQAPAPEQRHTLGNYGLKKKLGDGAMGAVYLAWDPINEKQVAIKTMALSATFNEEQLADIKSRFFREAEIIERLSHPNIVSVYDMGEEDELAYIAMELLNGSDLDPHTKPGNLLPCKQVLEIFASIADALDYAHAQDVVHRDVKPGNVMYDPGSGTVKVMDFGISRITTESKTKLGVVLGTPYYMSPEQLRGLKIGPASDIFSLGVSLYQMLAGKLPFTGNTTMELMSNIALNPHADILSLRPDLPSAVGAIIDRAMEKEIDKRFANCGEMAQAIRQCLATL